MPGTGFPDRNLLLCSSKTTRVGIQPVTGPPQEAYERVARAQLGVRDGALFWTRRSRISPHS